MVGQNWGCWVSKQKDNSVQPGSRWDIAITRNSQGSPFNKSYGLSVRTRLPDGVGACAAGDEAIWLFIVTGMGAPIGICIGACIDTGAEAGSGAAAVVAAGAVCVYAVYCVCTDAGICVGVRVCGGTATASAVSVMVVIAAGCTSCS